jgi:mannose-6-phosphate isomerase
VLSRFGRLPYLMKVLAAAAPLSLQVHPTQRQAQLGYAAEESAAVPRDAPHRRYKDPHHKPEMVVAVTDFEALCGLRAAEDAHRIMVGLDVAHPRWRPTLSALADGNVGAVFADLVRRPDAELVSAVAQAAHRRRDAGCEHDPEDETVLELAAAYPGDPGVVLSLLLNRVTLAPGQALFLPAGNVHAYLHGTAIEVMASSDNVLRCGLTPKFVDVDELLSVVSLSPVAVPWVQPRHEGGIAQYRPEAAEFSLDVATIDGRCDGLPGAGPRIVLALTGSVRLIASSGAVDVGRGDSVFVSDADGPLSATGQGRVAIAAVPGLLSTRRQASVSVTASAT